MANPEHLRLPTVESVKTACQAFDDANPTAEQALTELFNQYHSNQNRPHVLLKVVTLNRLYSTNVFAVYDVADHICQHGQEIDAALAVGAPEIVDTIAAVTIAATGKARVFWSFATKYCSWHNQASYPIWDSRVDRYLRSPEVAEFSRSLGRSPYRWEHYGEFVAAMAAFRDFYGLGSCSFKEIDKFLWWYGNDADQ